MENELAAMLLTQGGIAIVVALIVKLLVKKPLRLVVGLPVEGSGDVEEPALKRKYAIVLNTSAVALGVALSLVATAVLVDLSGANILSATLLGLFGAAAAVGVSEFGSNAKALKQN